MHRLSIGERGQMLAWDLIFGVIIFFIAFSLSIQLWETAYSDIRSGEEEYEMNWLAQTVSDQLVRTPGYPHDWNPSDVVVFGLVENSHATQNVESRILDPDKIMNLVTAFGNDYTGARNNLLGSSKFEMYIEIGCANRTDLGCLQGLRLDSVDKNVRCDNTVIPVSNKRTDSYIWFEAEEIWGNHRDQYCETKGCSNDNMSMIHGVEPERFKADGGTYQIWARTVESANENAMLTLDGAGHRLYRINYPGLVTWSWLGQQNISGHTFIGFSDTVEGDIVDAILLTTDRFYDPRFDNLESFGNPNIHGVCIAGAKDKGAHIMSSQKTAIVGQPVGALESFMGMQAINDKVVDIRVVIWEGEDIEPRHLADQTTTTTTLEDYDLICVDHGSEQELCVSFNQKWAELVNMRIVSADGKLICGDSNDIIVEWRGRHAGDENYFAFFVNGPQGLIGSCTSENPAEVGGQIYEYNMSCSFIPDANDISAPDGVHDLIVTVKDFGGWCNASDIRADDELRTRVGVESCLAYDVLGCDQYSGSIKLLCDNQYSKAVKAIHSVVLMGADPMQCGDSSRLLIRWEGTHGDAQQVQWAFILEDSPRVCLSGCTTVNETSEDGDMNYEMICEIDLDYDSDCRGNPYSIDDGEYTLSIVAESFDRNWCLNPASDTVEAVASTSVQVIGCEKPDTETVNFDYFIGDYGGQVTGAQLWTDITGAFEDSSASVSDPPVGHDENTAHTETIEDVPIGQCNEWNIWLSGVDDWLNITDNWVC